MRISKNITFVLFIILIMTFCYSTAQGQSSDSTSLCKGSWAFQFGMSSNFNLTSFQGTTISLKYHLSDMNAIRGGLSFSGTTGDGDGSRSGFVADTSIGSAPSYNFSNSFYGSVVIQYLWYLNSQSPIHLYVGCGPSISVNYSKYNYAYSYLFYSSYWTTNRYTSKSTKWLGGASVSAGVEWFPINWISLRAEYGETIQYQWSSYKRVSRTTGTAQVPRYDETSENENALVWDNSIVSLGINIYW